MKKIIPVLAVLAGTAAYVVYKMKKEEQKQIVDLDQGLLYDEDDDILDDEIEEGPISDPKACYEEVKETLEEAIDTAKDTVEDVAEDVKKKLKKSVKNAKENIEDFDENFIHLLKEEASALKEKSQALIQKLTESGDVHENERPVQHKVAFQSAEDLEEFKNEVINKGYVITKGDNDLELMILHIAPINEEKLLSHVLYLADKAKEYNGTYIDWESKVLY